MGVRVHRDRSVKYDMFKEKEWNWWCPSGKGNKAMGSSPVTRLVRNGAIEVSLRERFNAAWHGRLSKRELICQSAWRSLRVVPTTWTMEIDMENITLVKEVDGKLLIEIDTKLSFGVSGSGKNTIIASTKGNTEVTMPDGSTFKLGINCYKAVAK
jgi:hypothetical protein